MQLKDDFKVNTAKNMGLLCSVTLLSVLAASCGKSSTTNSAAPGGGEPTPPPTVANTLTAQSPSAAKCGSTVCTVQGVQNKTVPIAFTLDTGTADELKVAITAKNGDATNWTTSCPTTTITGSTTCTVTYSPKTAVPAGKNTATLSYTYKNNLGNTVTGQTPVSLTYQVAPLFKAPVASKIGSFSEYGQMSFANGVATFGLNTCVYPYANCDLYNLGGDAPAKLTSNIQNYAITPFASTQVVLQSTAAGYPTSVSIYDTVTSAQTTLPNNISSYAKDSSHVYGSDSKTGKVYSYSSATDTGTLLTTVQATSPYIAYTLTDNTLPILYTISTNGTGAEVVCSTSTTNPSATSACVTTKIILSSGAAFYQNQIAADGTIYVQTSNSAGTNNQIQGYAVTEAAGAVTAIAATAFHAVIPNGAGAVQMTFDSKNKILYAVVPTSTASPFTYNLVAYNAADGAVKWTSLAGLDFKCTMTPCLSNPFVTSDGTAVLMVAAQNNAIYGFTNTGAPAFTSTSYALPLPPGTQQAAVQLVATDSALSNTLDIPATTEGATPTTVYSVNIGW